MGCLGLHTNAYLTTENTEDTEKDKYLIVIDSINLLKYLSLEHGLLRFTYECLSHHGGHGEHGEQFQ